MSVQFGRWNFEGQPPDGDKIATVSATMAKFGPDSNESYSQGGITILYRAFHTTKESHRETQPHISSSGAIITWDGRLDNRAELVVELRPGMNVGSTDVEIVAAAYNRWGIKCLGKLKGDWALSIWNPLARSLLLAKDFIGTRHLYYLMDEHHITWSTILDPLVLHADKTFKICEEYIAGWMSYLPAAHLTPYVGIYAVPPSSFVLLQSSKHRVEREVCKYWEFDPTRKICYRSDGEYEDHFRIALATATQRRLRSDRPVIAELSGGMDSSSIVCIADTIIGRGASETPRLDTISWYDDGNPDLDERPFFAKVEERRGHTGCHIDLGALKHIEAVQHIPSHIIFKSDLFAVTPTADRGLSELFKRYEAYMGTEGHRVTLSGIGGDEVTGGGLPTPRPELQDLLARAQLPTLFRQLNAWAAKMKQNRLFLLWESIKAFLSTEITGIPKKMRPVPWLHPDFIRRNYAALSGYPYRVKLFGPLPSFQGNLHTLEVLRRLLADGVIQLRLTREVRFPYLDRDLLEFLFSIPREQVVRVGQRRSLMKRALVGIVPDEVLNRKGRMLVSQEPPRPIPAKWLTLIELGPQMLAGSIGFVMPDRFSETLKRAQRSGDAAINEVVCTLTLEFWLRHLAVQGLLSLPERQDSSSCFESKERHMPVDA